MWKAVALTSWRLQGTPAPYVIQETSHITKEMVLFRSGYVQVLWGHSVVGTREGKILLSQGSKWRRPCQGISLIWAKIRHIHEALWDPIWVVQKESWQNLWQLEVSETWVSFASSASTIDLPHSRNSMSAHLNGAIIAFHHGSSSHSSNKQPH